MASSKNIFQARRSLKLATRVASMVRCPSSRRQLGSIWIILVMMEFRLPFSDHSQDAVYSSHCLEHILDYRSALREWYRVLKIGGYLVIAVPHHFLYERRRQLPSHWNRDHKRFYTPGNLLREIEDALEPNTYRVRHLADNDFGFDYSIPPREGAVGCQEIELVLEKLKKPFWDLEDGTSRIYHASEFSARLEKRALLPLESDFLSPTPA